MLWSANTDLTISWQWAKEPLTSMGTMLPPSEANDDSLPHACADVWVEYENPCSGIPKMSVPQLRRHLLWWPQ